jgi:glucosamine--fructose-6-phosphate aminotransferase (isomerizing)
VPGDVPSADVTHRSDLDREIREQPEAVARLLRDGRDDVAAAAELLAARNVDGLQIAARGTSDHAAIYAQYVLGARNGLPVALATPSLVTLYGAAPRFGRAAVVGISQSGASPDVVGVLEAARAQGAPTIAITNAPGSPLARVADRVIDLRAAEERAVAATKTYTTELTAVAMLSAALAGDTDAEGQLAGLPNALAAALESDAAAAAAAGERAGMAGCVVLGRGFEYATAREWALKVKELARVIADPYSAADFLHGPLALIDTGFPVLAVATSGIAGEGMIDLLARLRDEHGADVVAIGDREDVPSAARLAVPTGVSEWLRPIVSIVPGQLFARHLALARGLDPDRPHHIGKVTRTR